MSKKAFVAIMALVVVFSACGGTGSSTGKEDVVLPAESVAVTPEESNAESTVPVTDDTAAWYLADNLWVEEKKDTPLELFGEDIPLPPTWDDLYPYVDEALVKGRMPFESKTVDLTKEDLKDSPYLPTTLQAYMDIKGARYDVEFVLAESETDMTVGECMAAGRFFISGRDSGMQDFFNIDGSLKPAEGGDYDERWLLKAIFDKYGCPDYIGDSPYCTAFYWARDGYYFGLQAQHLEGVNTTLSFQTLLPAVAWDSFCEWMGQESVGLPLVPYGAIKYTNDGKTAPPVAKSELTAYEDAIDRTLAESVGLVETSEVLGSTGINVPIVTAEGGSLYSADRGMLGDWIHGVRRKVGEDEIAIYHHYIRSGDLAELTQTLSLYVSASSSSTKAVYDDLQKPAHTLIVVDDDPMRDGDEKYFSAYRILAIDDTLSVITEVAYHRYHDVGSEEEKAVFDTYKTICGVYGIGTDVLTQYGA